MSAGNSTEVFCCRCCGLYAQSPFWSHARGGQQQDAEVEDAYPPHLCPSTSSVPKDVNRVRSHHKILYRKRD
eukprot:4578300-Amphidinium_carterae.1